MSALVADGLVVAYGSGSHRRTVVDGVSLSVEPGGVLGLVGESGCGKSTIARAVCGLLPVAAGRVTLGDRVVVEPGERRGRRGGAGGAIQMVFQDPLASLNPRMPVGRSIAEGVEAAGVRGRRAVLDEVERLLALVRVDPRRARDLPRAFSGGQRQRVAIARALAARPQFLVADEITSALDVSVQGAVLNLLRDVQRETGVGVLFISHNLAVVRFISDRIAVMDRGRIVESRPTEVLVTAPENAYTRALLDAVPTIAGPAGSSGP